MIGIDYLVTDTGMYVNHRLPCLAQYAERLRVIKLNPATDDIDSKARVVDVSEEIGQLDSNRKGFDSWQYQCISAHAKEIQELLTGHALRHTWYRDIMILGDLSADVLYALDVLQKSDFQGEIHLILPLPFERTVKGSAQYEVLSNLSKVRTLAIYDPYKIATEQYGDRDPETIARVINEQTEYLLGKYKKLSGKMLYQGKDTKYFFDFKRESYVDTDTLFVLDDYVITHTLGLPIDPYYIDKGKAENEYFIESLRKPVPRPDGKLVCEQLRTIRKEFAKINGLDFEFRECTYNGPCAGTCQVCDTEAMKLRMIAEKNGNVKYPGIRLEESE